MQIGSDFDKIQFEAFGLDLLEPNAFIGDSLLGLLSFFLAVLIFRMRPLDQFYRNWFYFFLVMGAGFILGGLGHLMWNYWGVEGKYAAWYAGLISTLFAEQAMISISDDKKERAIFKSIVRLKFVYAFLILTFLIVTQDLTNFLGRGLSVSLISTGIGTLFAFGFLPLYFRKRNKPRLHFFWISLLILIPVAIVQSMKFNVAPWFDRNDISHILMLMALTLYFLGIRFYRRRMIILNETS